MLSILAKVAKAIVGPSRNRLHKGIKEVGCWGREGFDLSCLKWSGGMIQTKVFCDISSEF